MRRRIKAFLWEIGVCQDVSLLDNDEILKTMGRTAIDNKDSEILRKIDRIRKKNAATKKRRTLKNILAISSFVIAFSFIALFIVSTNIKGTSPLIVKNNKEIENQSANSLSPNRNVNGGEEISDTEGNNLTVKKSPVPIKRGYLEIRVAKSVVCKEVKERNPIGERRIFSVKENRFSVVWTEVRSKVFPRELKHIYYLNGKKYCEVPLLVKYPRMRTWSKITLRDRNQIGSWKVHIVTEEGTVLEEIGFEVRS